MSLGSKLTLVGPTSDETASTEKEANSNKPVGGVSLGGEAITISAFPWELASSMVDLITTVEREAEVVISLVSLTLFGSKEKTTLAKTTGWERESNIILTVCSPGREIESGEKEMLTLSSPA